MSVLLTVLTVIGWIFLGITGLIAGVFALAALLLSVPVHLTADYSGEMRLKFWYGFIPIQILPSKPKKDKPPKKLKKEKRESAETKPKKSLHEILAPYGGLEHFPQTMPQLLEALLEVGKMLNSFRRAPTICYLRVVIVCGGSDAAQAAINYGRAWPILIGIETALRKSLRLKKFEGNAVLDYTAYQQIFQGAVKLRLWPIRLAGVAVFRGLRVLRRYLRIKKYGKQHQPVHQSEKGVTVHEQSST